MVADSSASCSIMRALPCTSSTNSRKPDRLWPITAWPCSTARPASRLASAAALASPATCWMVASSSPKASRICPVSPAWRSAPSCRAALMPARAWLLPATCSALWRMVPTSSTRYWRRRLSDSWISRSSRLVLPRAMASAKSPSAQRDRAGARPVRVRARRRCKVSISRAISRIRPIIRPWMMRTSPAIFACWPRTSGSSAEMACCTASRRWPVLVARATRRSICSRVRCSSAG
ncbi:hypothetical protein D3C75_706000 [compost metagenome]